MPPKSKPDRTFPESIRKAYTAVMTGEGRILPIVESVGRRVLREIDPGSREARRLLAEGRVALWSDGADRARRIPVEEAPSALGRSPEALLAGAGRSPGARADREPREPYRHRQARTRGKPGS